MQTSTQTSETSDIVVVAESAPKLVLVKSEMVGDLIIQERDGCKFCLGCPICESELEDEI